MQHFLDLNESDSKSAIGLHQAKELEEKARSHLCDLFRILESKNRKMEMINQLLINLKEHKAV